MKNDDMQAWIWNLDALARKKVRQKRETHASPLRAEHALGPHDPDWGIVNDIPKTNTSSSWHLNHHRDSGTASHITLKRLVNFKQLYLVAPYRKIRVFYRLLNYA